MQLNAEPDTAGAAAAGPSTSAAPPAGGPEVQRLVAARDALLQQVGDGVVVLIHKRMAVGLGGGTGRNAAAGGLFRGTERAEPHTQ